MCTVTYVPLKNGCIITSNRDEKVMRGKALFPQAYKVNNKLVVYPKDPDAGGTWIGMTKSGHAAVLLNGALVKHQPQPPYQKSRGLVLLDILSADSPCMEFFHLRLRHIEPFTLVMVEDDYLY